MVMVTGFPALVAPETVIFTVPQASCLHLPPERQGSMCHRLYCRAIGDVIDHHRQRRARRHPLLLPVITSA